ncbi:VTC domain-containing protein [Roseobacter denitrificans]|nr:VTC domain-containing protein [Roseobacter denitrificans]
MLTRLDNKYVVPLSVLESLAPVLGDHFDILEIDGTRRFAYRTQYFDTPDMTSFRHHVQGRRRRSKLRTRHYLSADICFVEVKLKSLRKVTVKKRLPHDPDALDQLTDPALQFAEQSHLGHYGRGLNAPYLPVMQMQYERMTLVAREGGERLTIDRNLQFWNDRNEAATSPEMVVIETKSAFGRGIADSILRRNGSHPIGSCSKYCIGLAAIGLVPRFNRFLPAFRRLLPHLATPQSARVAMPQTA